MVLYLGVVLGSDSVLRVLHQEFGYEVLDLFGPGLFGV